MRPRILPVVAVAAVFAAAAAFAPAHEGRGEGQEPTESTGCGPLAPPEGSPQPLATGSVEIQQRLDGRQSFEVETRNVDAAVDLAVYVDIGAEVFVLAGPLPAGAADRELELDTGEGDVLPGGVATVDLLVGMAVQVRDSADVVVLAGTVPALGSHACGDDDGDDADDDDDDGGHDRVRPAFGRAALMRDAASPDDDASGCVSVKRTPAHEEFEIEARRLDAAAGYEFLLEDAGGAMASLGTATADAEGEAEVEFSTEDGGALPQGAASVDELAGRRVEVRTAAGAVVLLGRVPVAATRAEKVRARARLRDDATRARAGISACIDTRAGRERLAIDLKAALERGATVELWIADGTGTLQLAGTATARGGGHVRFRFDTRKGQALPLGVETLAELSGRAFEIRAGGSAVFAGSLPAL